LPVFPLYHLHEAGDAPHNPRHESNLQGAPVLASQKEMKKDCLCQKNKGRAENILHFFLRFCDFL
jgi:hypothetical protein